MIDTNSAEFKLGKTIGYYLASYLKVRLILQGAKFIIKNGKRLIFFKNTLSV